MLNGGCRGEHIVPSKALRHGPDPASPPFQTTREVAPRTTPCDHPRTQAVIELAEAGSGSHADDGGAAITGRLGAIRTRRSKMAPLDTSTWLRMRQDAAFPFAAAQRQLAQTLHERSEWIGERDRHLPNAAALAARRAEVAEAILTYLGPLTRYVQREVSRWEERSLVPPGAVTVDDIVAVTCGVALERAGEAPPRGRYDWLRRIARREALIARLDEETRRRWEVSLESPVAVGGEEERGLVLRLIDVLADPYALLPEQILAHEAVRRGLDRALARLPERWREAFLLHALDGWTVEEIATAEGIAIPEVEPVLGASRMFLREWLNDADRWRVR